MQPEKTRTREALERAQAQGFIHIPHYMWDAIEVYIERRIQPGHFLTAVLSNDLKEACARADDTNSRHLKDYVSFFFSYAPIGCWGNEQNVRDWLSPEKETEDA